VRAGHHFLEKELAMSAQVTITSTRRLTDVRKWISYDPIDGTAVSKRCDESHEVNGDVNGAESIPDRYHSKPAWRPDRVEATYIRTDRGDWHVQLVTVRGHQLKANGSPGRRRVQRSWWVTESEIPEWAAKFATTNLPKDGQE
jgi:hypothetical protein